MPSIIDYPIVLKTLEVAGLRCVYPSSGAFGLSPDAVVYIAGWIAGEDPTIRPEVRALAKVVAPPASRSLALHLVRAWQTHFPGPIWLMPSSHWAYELQFGNSEWLTALLNEYGIDAAMLQSRSDGSAIQFQSHEANQLATMIEKLFDQLTGSDFTIAFPGRAAVALLHHHTQIWWQTNDQALSASLRAFNPTSS